MTATQPQPDDPIATWLDAFYANVNPAGWLTLFTVDKGTGKHDVDWARADRPGELALAAHRRADHCDVWFGVATRRERLPGIQRGGKADCAEIPALWVDIDVDGPNHAADRLPPTMQDAYTLLAKFPLPPTATLNTGGGLQAFWLLAEPIAADDEAAALLARWGATWAQHARVAGEAAGMEGGWHIDNVFNVDRIMRLPGTVNRKTVPTLVEIVEADWTRTFGVDDLDSHTVEIQAPEQPSGDLSPRIPYIGPDRPGDAFNAMRTGGEILQAAGFTFARRGGGEEHWTGPWKTPREGHSATVYPDGHTTIWSDTAVSRWPSIELRRPYDPFGLFTVMFHGGDFTAASDDLEARGYGTKAVGADDLAWVEEAMAMSTPTDQAAPALATAGAGVSDAWPDPLPLGGARQHLPEFPLEALPGWVADHCRSVAQRIQVSADLPAMLALTALSLAATSKNKIEINDGWTEHLNLYLVVALPPGEGKSPAESATIGPLRRFETELIGQKRPEVVEGQARKRLADKRAKNAEDIYQRTGDAEHQQAAVQAFLEADAIAVPVPPRLITGDATPEALTKLIAVHNRMAIVSTEGGVFDLMVGRYSESLNLDVYLQAWSGDPITVDRIGRDPDSIAEALLTIGITVQPQVIRKLADRPELAGRGLTARFMYSIPKPMVGERDVRAQVVSNPQRQAELDYEESITHLAATWWGWEWPGVLRLTDEARETAGEWWADLEGRLGPDGDLAGMAEWVGKLRTSMFRVAGLLHLGDGRAHNELVDASTIQRAIQVGDYWVAHAMVVHSLWGTSEVVDQATKIADWLAEKNAAEHGLAEVTARDIYRGVRRMFEAVTDMQPALELLIDRGWLRPLFHGQLELGKRGRPSPNFAVHPVLRGGVAVAPGIGHVTNVTSVTGSADDASRTAEVVTSDEGDDEAVTGDVVTTGDSDARCGFVTSVTACPENHSQSHVTMAPMSQDIQKKSSLSHFSRASGIESPDGPEVVTRVTTAEQAPEPTPDALVAALEAAERAPRPDDPDRIPTAAELLGAPDPTTDPEGSAT